MRKMRLGIRMRTVAMLMLILAVVVGVAQVYGKEEKTVPSSKYIVELSRWGISNDGTNAVETTKGINDVLIWAYNQKIKEVMLPAGTYLIDKSSYINMVSDITFELADGAILQKETNGTENYKVLYIGNGVKNVTLKGGTYRGDRDTHDYSKKDHQHSSGTHEAGHGILTEGAFNVIIDGVKSVNFTGDGLVLGGYGKMSAAIYGDTLVSGGINDKGLPRTDANKVRTKTSINFTHPVFSTERTFEFSNSIHLPAEFEVFFYKSNGVFLSKLKTKLRDEIQIPQGASHFHVVFDKPKTLTGAYLEVWHRSVTENVVVKNSEFAFNRRQGITVGGANNVWITNNDIHDIRGTAPQSGIDLEGGFGENGFLNSNIKITKNRFYNNAAYDVILYDGYDGLVEDNHLASKGAIGVGVSSPFKGAVIRNNHFDGSRIVAENDAEFIDNRMNDSSAIFDGPNIKVDRMELIDSQFSVNAKVAFGVAVSNVTITNNNKNESGLILRGQPIKIQNMTIIGTPKLRAVTGNVAPGSIFDRLRVIGFNPNFTLTLPPGTYNHCEFEGADGGNYAPITASWAGKYVFNSCTFKSSASNATLLFAEHPELELTIRNSSFELLGNTQAISVQAAKKLTLLNNTITANFLTSNKTEMIKLNELGRRDEKYDIRQALIKGNTIKTNIAAVGISTLYAGKGAPPYTIEDNTLYKATLALKANDRIGNNTMYDK